MPLSILENLNMQRHASMPIYQHIAEQILNKINSGKLTSGDKLPTEHSLAAHLGINRLTVSKSYQILEEMNLVKRRRGMGTFILETQGKQNVKNDDKTIYILTPHPIHVTLQLESSLTARRIHYGASIENSSNLIQTVPVSKKLENPLSHIDWDSVRNIPEGAQVFVSNMWFKDILPFLLERNVRGVFLSEQQSEIGYYKEYQQLRDAGWCFMKYDRLSAMEQAVEYLSGLGRSKTAVIKRYQNEPQHPFRGGMIAGYEKCGMIYNENLYKEINPKSSFLELENEIVELWQRTQFDALVVGNADIIRPVYKALNKKLKLRIPDDVALMSFSDNPTYIDFETPVTAIDFPYVDIGREITKIFNRKEFTLGETIFQSSIIEREATRKGAGAYINHKFMPEISVNENLMDINP